MGIRNVLTYGNLTATIALFVALGGTSYALTLPRNSVGSREMRPNSVGPSELKSSAVGSRDIRNRSIAVRDISPSARKSLRGTPGAPGPRGPDGVTYFAKFQSGGGRAGGNSTHSTPMSVNTIAVYFAKPVNQCAYSATLARVPGGGVDEPSSGSSITVAPTDDGGVLVRTWDENNHATALPFHLIVAC
jgi:hypothetical protein